MVVVTARRTVVPNYDFQNGGLARRTRPCGRGGTPLGRSHRRRRAEGGCPTGGRGPPVTRRRATVCAARRLVVALSRGWTPLHCVQPSTGPGTRTSCRACRI